MTNDYEIQLQIEYLKEDKNASSRLWEKNKIEFSIPRPKYRPLFLKKN
jgi:hypothetical protein